MLADAALMLNAANPSFNGNENNGGVSKEKKARLTNARPNTLATHACAENKDRRKRNSRGSPAARRCKPRNELAAKLCIEN